MATTLNIEESAKKLGKQKKKEITVRELLPLADPLAIILQN